MNPTGKKFTALFLVFSLVTLSVNLYAKEKRGAKLIITKKDGQRIKGELIAVKEQSLLLLDSETGIDVSIDIWNVKTIEIKGNTQALKGRGKGSLYGFLIGGGLGVVAGVSFISSLEGDAEPGGAILGIALYGALGGAIGYIIGGIIGAFVKESEVIHIEGMADLEIILVLEKLRKKARIRDYK